MVSIAANTGGTAEILCKWARQAELDQGQRDRLFQRIGGRPVLSISEADDPCTVGSLFCLRVSDQQVAFEVNLDSVARSGVHIHPSVLQLSRRRAEQP